MKLSARTEKTTGFTVDDLIHLVSGGASWKVKLGTLLGITNPIGTVLDAVPSDGGTWLQMNGQVVSQATYPKLFKLLGHRPEFAWTQTPEMHATLNPAHICYGNGLYVAVGGSGMIVSSPDLITWTSQNSGVATQLNAVCWDSVNSLFVAVGNSNVILTSPDAVTWTSRTSGVTSGLANVVAAGGRIVAVGSAGWITYSTDGVNWTASAPNSSPNYAWLVYAHGVWFSMPLSASATGILYSTDGTTWNYVAKPTTNNLVFAGFDATYFYVQDATTAEIWRSTNGASWAAVAYTAGLSSYVFSNSIVPMLFLGSPGVIAMGGNAGIAYTEDGFATLQKGQPTSEADLMANLPYVLSTGCLNINQKFLIGVSQSSPTGIFYSVDGKKWNRERTPNFANSMGGSNNFKDFYHNGIYFNVSFPGRRSFYAPAPYDPATQFQIPTRTDASGNALYIKAA